MGTLLMFGHEERLRGCSGQPSGADRKNSACSTRWSLGNCRKKSENRQNENAQCRMIPVMRDMTKNDNIKQFLPREHAMSLVDSFNNGKVFANIICISSDGKKKK